METNPSAVINEQKKNEKSMVVNTLRAFNFRNFNNVEIDFCDSVNIIKGMNAQGKTNLLESILLSLSAKSHRESNYRNFIGQYADSASVYLNGVDIDGLDFEVEASFSEEKSLSINGRTIRRRSELGSMFSFIFFGPDELSIIKGAPYQRRAFLDEAVSKLTPEYSLLLGSYTKALRQRNAFLKEYNIKPSEEMLGVYDLALAEYGSKVLKQRIRFLKEFLPFLKEGYAEIASSAEKISVNYYTDTAVFDDSYKEKYLSLLKQSRKEDLFYKTTKYGIHHDDFIVFLDGRQARQFASQGQQRSVAVCLKVSMIKLIKQIRGCDTVVLLDDIMSELDSVRQKNLLKLLCGMQTFITCVDDSFAANISDKNVYSVKNANVKRI